MSLQIPRLIAATALFGLTAGVAQAEETWGGWTFYLGDMHAHTGASGDGGSSDLGTCTGDCGSVVDLISIARANGLDYLAITDHSNGEFSASDADYGAVQADVLLAHDPTGGFITIPSAELKLEYADGSDLGHKNIFFFSDDDSTLGTLQRTDLVPSTAATDSLVWSCSDLWIWASDLRNDFGDLLLIPHHTSALLPMATDWDCHSDLYTPVTETYSIHGNSIMRSPEFDPQHHGEIPRGSVHDALDETRYGLRLGFIAGSDSHDTRPGGICERAGPNGDDVPYGGGLAMAMLPEGTEYTRAALYDAYMARQVYGTSGPMLPATVEWSALGRSLGGMGEEISVPSGPHLRVTVRVRPQDVPHVTKVVLVDSRSNETELYTPLPGVWMQNLHPAMVPDWAYVRIHVDGDSWWGIGACDDGGDSAEERVWLSPTWFD